MSKELERLILVVKSRVSRLLFGRWRLQPPQGGNAAPALVWFPLTNPVAPSQYYRLLWSLNKTVKLEQGCVSAEGSGIYRAEHICMTSDKTLLICLCCPQDSLVFTNNWATDSVIITMPVLPCCCHHYAQILPLWH